MARLFVLNLALASTTALAHPGGASISMGTNPVMSAGGSLTVPTSGTVSSGVLTAPSDRDVILTDVSLSGSSSYGNCSENWPVTLTVAGIDIAMFTTGPSLTGSSRPDQRFQQSLTSGLRIPAGEGLTLSTYRHDWNGDCSWSRTAEIRWTFTGYYAQP